MSSTEAVSDDLPPRLPTRRRRQKKRRVEFPRGGRVELQLSGESCIKLVGFFFILEVGSINADQE